MTIADTHRGFLAALTAGQVNRLSEFVDPDAYTENCVGLTGWTVGLDVALTNFQYGIGGAVSDLTQEALETIETEESLIIRSRCTGTHTGTFLGLPPTNRTIVWDAIDMFRAGPDGRIVWRYLISDWEAARQQILGDAPPGDTPVDYAINAPPGHPNARPA